MFQTIFMNTLHCESYVFFNSFDFTTTFIDIFQFAQSTLTTSWILSVHRCRTFGSRKVRQPSVAEHKAGENLSISVDAEFAGQVYWRQRV